LRRGNQKIAVRSKQAESNVAPVSTSQRRFRFTGGNAMVWRRSRRVRHVAAPIQDRKAPAGAQYPSHLRKNRALAVQLMPYVCQEGQVASAVRKTGMRGISLEQSDIARSPLFSILSIAG